ncbi:MULTISPECIES: ABC transporter ATP-binding protein [unclassified Paenibacillus]|uniref:ABC transporter ATP-binding protein n=1 Tax=unclassified Paenibacillus TaxID=185978 RepID=UPI0024074667|nr:MULTISPECIES: ABC transporter ATP-binding protein [unclassified Paenibacillus]MDF9842991.1 putative hydroxymethylpyrimidine transport system ATP-binding protein [Paenibacillus sp. PastF-2]MDF9849579.1 putative hydroxymethylpyrimidine transport system ATP-binding protein [Paenibacillus sp. PastM-2]MDF9856046.1 putative hydroxymethylpyrimidine transport system ATP-binding protein [Paenibacillus sp. PastF-1]MDH6481422.1 putative hydroxymethylpyrimidine transport system ATP-binding protein [Paen
MLSITNLSYSYGAGSGRPVIQGLSMNVQQGEFISLVGASGCGKSTLLRIIAGLLEPSSGDISFGGRPSTGSAARLGKIGYMPQQDLLLPWRTVLDNCLLAWELKRSGSKEAAVQQIRSLLHSLGLAGTENAYPEELSGGMRQRIALARTLSAGSELLLLDEPFGALDALTKRGLHRWLLQLWSSLGRTVLFITHDLEEALLLSDRICLMHSGSLQEIAVPLPRPRHGELIYQPQFMQLREELERRLYESIAH